MKINSINTNSALFANTTTKKNMKQNFKARLEVDNKVIERMTNELSFRDVIFQFRGWLDAQQPKDGVVKIIAKRGKILENISPRNLEASFVPISKYCREDLEISMGDKRSGFYYNPLNSIDNIFEDLKYVYECIK